MDTDKINWSRSSTLLAYRPPAVSLRTLSKSRGSREHISEKKIEEHRREKKVTGQKKNRRFANGGERKSCIGRGGWKC